MGYPETFEGFCVDSPKTWNKFSKQELKPKPFEDYDIDVEIAACGVCGSDIHTLTGGWGDFQGPLCVGHEVVGRAVRVGSKVRSEIKEGDRVGVGAQVWACLKCKVCESKNENYCPHMVDTYNAKYEDGSSAHGGYASHIRAHEYFTFKIPDGLETEIAAPLLCAGITVYSPCSAPESGQERRSPSSASAVWATWVCSSPRPSAPRRTPSRTPRTRSRTQRSWVRRRLLSALIRTGTSPTPSHLTLSSTPPTPWTSSISLPICRRST
ncbi:hypothetical protein MCOR02_008309 [Pyricularia oryzae]|nr:hypothetical protein MCOR02_008309 [Pyricularia oryzae]